MPAKKYLTYKYPEYYEKLMPASKLTLQYQGGMMTKAEAVGFEKDPLFRLYVKLREWDDKAKEAGRALTSMNKFREMALAHLENE